MTIIVQERTRVLEFWVEGEPRAKQSFRVAGRGRGFTPAYVKAWQADVGWAAQQAMRKLRMYDPLIQDLAVEMEFHLGNARKIDLDNLSKCVLDGLNGICCADDRQVMELHLKKTVSREKPGVMVRLDLLGPL